MKLLILTLLFTSCAHKPELLKVSDKLLSPIKLEESISTEDIAMGLKEALDKGIQRSVKIVSKKDGFYSNPFIKLSFPKEAIEVKKTLNKLRLTRLVDEVESSLNHAAERASSRALHIFSRAIRDLSFDDARGILFGHDKDAATVYLRSTTTKELEKQFMPIISRSLNEVGATRLWRDAFYQYNRVPFVKKVNPNLKEYVLKRTMNGLFHYVQIEEQKLRENPLARTTKLLEKVFSQLDR